MTDELVAQVESCLARTPPAADAAKAGANASLLWVWGHPRGVALHEAVVARGWSRARPLGDDDWCVWNHGVLAVFRHPGVIVRLDGATIELVGPRSTVEAAPGPLVDVRVDVPTGRGHRTGRARGADWRLVLKGKRFTFTRGERMTDLEW